MSNLIGRRELFQLASAALVGMAAGRKGWALPDELVQNVAKVANWRPIFLDGHQAETVSVLADIIIPETDTPGAKAANVHRYIDLFLSIRCPGAQSLFTDGLASLDKAARDEYRQDFIKCSEAQRYAVLERMDKAGDAFFQSTKKMVVSIYFATPEGYRELGKFGGPPSTFGCQHAAGTHT